jgi:hypothetical protein
MWYVYQFPPSLRVMTLYHQVHSLVYSSLNPPFTILATVFPHPVPHIHDHPCTALVCPTLS